MKKRINFKQMFDDEIKETLKETKAYEKHKISKENALFVIECYIKPDLIKCIKDETFRFRLDLVEISEKLKESFTYLYNEIEKFLLDYPAKIHYFPYQKGYTYEPYCVIYVDAENLCEMYG